MARDQTGRAGRRRRMEPPDRNVRKAEVRTLSNTSREEIIELLAKGPIASCRSIPWSSNYTFLVSIVTGDRQCLAVYKPRQGESPLWDFPDGTLYLREYAAYLVSEGLGWSLIPPTVIRDGPYGVGSVQLYVDADPHAHYLTFRNDSSPEAVRLAAFDYLVNNADRKSGHCLKGRDGRIWAIDNGLTFHVLPKLRTVIWDFQGKRLPEDIVRDLLALQPRLQEGGSLAVQLGPLLSEAEIEALRHRLDHLLATRRFPMPGAARHYPWPLV